MFQKITAFIVFFGGLGGVLFFIVHVYQGDINGLDEWFDLSVLLIPSISGVIYVISTKFGDAVFPDVINTYQENQTLKKQINQKELEEQKARAERRMEKFRYLTDQIIITNALRGEDDTETAKYILLNNYKEKIESIEAGLDEDRDEIICRHKGRPV